MTQALSFQVIMADPFEIAVDKVTSALNNEGFGVLTQIDVKATLKEKLDANFHPYTILGACNPSLAQQALLSDPLVGLLLPCNVTIQETEDGSQVNIINPDAMMDIPPFSYDDRVCEVAAEARSRLERVAATLENG